MNPPSTFRRTPSGHARRGFTLVELLVVFVVLAILVALLLPAINGAVRTAKNTAASSNLNQIGQALAAFKAKYGDYPPSRVYLSENGFFNVTSTTSLTNLAGYPGKGGNYAAVTADQTDMAAVGQLAQRSLGYLRKFFPKVVFSTSAAVWAADSTEWYDFNGNGVYDQQPYILQGHQCLVFFLGGLPQVTDTGYGMTGFAKNPANPFTQSTNREAPFFEFVPSRLVFDPVSSYDITGKVVPNQVPGYLDSLGNTLDVRGGTINYIAYFSAYGNNGYDPNDVNFPTEKAGTPATTVNLAYKVRFPVKKSGAGTLSPFAVSPSPNPYTSSTTNPATGTVTYMNAQTYQLISAGMDGLFGPGGQYAPNTAAQALPNDSVNLISPAQDKGGASARLVEKDNLTNFQNGRLD